MKPVLSLSFALLGLQSLCFASSTFDAIVVAEQIPQAERLTAPTPDHPVYYALSDGGYIEAGNSIAGEKPPTPAAVSSALQKSLAAQGYQPATAVNQPALWVTYHWGVIRRGLRVKSRSIPVTYPGLFTKTGFTYSNLNARLSLVSTEKQAAKAIDYMRNLEDLPLTVPRVVGATVTETFDLARDGRYFAIVSAYDYPDLTRGSDTLLWRVKLSAAENTGSMEEILPALLASGNPYWGHGFTDRQYLSAERLPPAESRTDLTPPPTSEALAGIANGLVPALLKQEHDFFSGEISKGYENPALVLPRALSQRITAYQNEKSALRAILADRIKNASPGPENQNAIDAFNSENSARIAALRQSREEIRSELAKLRSPHSAPTMGQPLDALLREFATDVQQLEVPPATAK